MEHTEDQMFLVVVVAAVVEHLEVEAEHLEEAAPKNQKTAWMRLMKLTLLLAAMEEVRQMQMLGFGSLKKEK